MARPKGKVPDWIKAEEMLKAGKSPTAVCRACHVNRSTLYRKAERERWTGPGLVLRSIETLEAFEEDGVIPVWENGGLLGADARAYLRQNLISFETFPDELVNGLMFSDPGSKLLLRDARRQRKMGRNATPETLEAEVVVQGGRKLLTKGKKPKVEDGKLQVLDPEVLGCKVQGYGGSLGNETVSFPSELPLPQLPTFYLRDRKRLLREIRKRIKLVDGLDLSLKDIAGLKALVALHKELSGVIETNETKAKQTVAVQVNIGGLSQL